MFALHTTRFLQLINRPRYKTGHHVCSVSVWNSNCSPQGNHPISVPVLSQQLTQPRAIIPSNFCLHWSVEPILSPAIPLCWHLSVDPKDLRPSPISLAAVTCLLIQMTFVLPHPLLSLVCWSKRSSPFPHPVAVTCLLIQKTFALPPSLLPLDCWTKTLALHCFSVDTGTSAIPCCCPFGLCLSVSAEQKNSCLLNKKTLALLPLSLFICWTGRPSPSLPPSLFALVCCSKRLLPCQSVCLRLSVKQKIVPVSLRSGLCLFVSVCWTKRPLVLPICACLSKQKTLPVPVLSLSVPYVLSDLSC